MRSKHKELFCQWLKTELGGVDVYLTALRTRGTRAGEYALNASCKV